MANDSGIHYHFFKKTFYAFNYYRNPTCALVAWNDYSVHDGWAYSYFARHRRRGIDPPRNPGPQSALSAPGKI